MQKLIRGAKSDMTNKQKEFKKTNKNSKSLTTIDMQKVEVNNLLKRLGELEDAPLIWINKKVYDMAQEIEKLNKENKELDKACARKSRYIDKKDLEIGRLNNIINELEKYINEEYIYDELGMKIFDASKLQDKLQELKGVDKE